MRNLAYFDAEHIYDFKIPSQKLDKKRWIHPVKFQGITDDSYYMISDWQVH